MRRGDRASGSVRSLRAGTDEIGKKVVKEASEVWMAAEHEGCERTAQEIAQLLYHVQGADVLATSLRPEDVYRHL